MESQNSVILTSCEEEADPLSMDIVKEIVEKADDAEIEEGEYLLVSNVQEDLEDGEMQVIAEENETPSLSQMCRTCANANGHLVPIFTGEGLEQDLCSKIQKHLPIKVTKDDSLPQQLCYHCAATILAWSELSEGCLYAQNQLLRLQEQAEQRKSLAYQQQEEEKDDQIEENTIGDGKFVNRELPQEEQRKHGHMKNAQVKNEEVSESERSSNHIQAFLMTNNKKTFPQSSKLANFFEKSSASISIPQGFRSDKGSKLKILNQKGLLKIKNPSKIKKPSKITNLGSPTTIEALPSTNPLDTKDKKKPWAIDPLQCDQCGKKFRLQESFLTHSRIHTGEKPYTCHVCGKQFRQTGSLYYHLKHVHGGVKNHSCDICGRSFAMKAAMEDHRRIHTGERPYVCDSCGKTFKTKASLYIHRKIHTDEYPHQCTFCKKDFRWKQQLLGHLTTHTGVKNHICDICGKAFGVKNDLNRHKKIHSKEKPYFCEQCGLSFAQKRYLKNHERARHS